MLDRIYSNNTMVSLEKSLEATKLRDEIINHNLANADTPNFKRSYVEFEQYMYAALRDEEPEGLVMKKTRKGHFSTEDVVDIADISPQVFRDDSTTLRMDGNNVDEVHEMNELAKNDIHYRALVDQLNEEFTRIKKAIGRS